MTEIVVVPATTAHAEELAHTMSQADRDEVWAMAHWTPEIALEKSMRGSRWKQAALVDGRVMCIFGVAKSLMGGLGRPWLLGSDLIRQYPKEFMRACQTWKPRVLAQATLLVNYVDARYTSAVSWLRWFGFEVEPPQPLGPDGVLFHRIMMETR